VQCWCLKEQGWETLSYVVRSLALYGAQKHIKLLLERTNVQLCYPCRRLTRFETLTSNNISDSGSANVIPKNVV